VVSVLVATATAILPILAAMQSVTAQRLLTVREAAEFLRIGRNNLYIAARDGRIPSYKIGASVRFDLDELKAWLESNRRGPRADAP
jgi:excisionase family DNA binding protein